MSRPSAKPAALSLLILAYIAFISLGLPDGLLGVAWPSIRRDFALPLDALGLMLFAGMAGYMTSSFLSGRLASGLGIGALLAASCGLTGLCLLCYTLAPAWWVMVCLSGLGGFGAGAIDAGLNTYVASHHPVRMMQWLHASYGIGVTLGPLIMTAGLRLSGSWRPGYIVVSGAQILLAACFLATAARWRNTGGEAEDLPKLNDYRTPLRETLRQPRAWLSMSLFFVYTGVELSLGAWAYTLLTESRGLDAGIAGLWAGGYWATFTAGRILAGLYTRRISVRALLYYSLLLALTGALLLWWNPAPFLSLLGVACIGFAIAPIFPGFVSGTIERVGARHTSNTIGMQIGAAGFGSALLPGLAGFLARRVSLEIIPAYLVFLLLLLLGMYTLSVRGQKTP